MDFMKTMGNDILTPELIAQGWCETLHIDKAPNDGIYQTAYFNGLGEIIVQDELLNKKDAIKGLCRFDTYRVLTPVTPNTLTISVDDAKNLVSFDGVYDAGKVLLSTKKVTKQLEAMK